MRRPVRAALAVLTLAVLSALASITTAQEWKSVETAQPETTHTAAAVVAITPEPTPTSSRYTGIELTEEEVDTLARLVWLEARGEPFEGQVAVVEVVLNRILSPLFPDTVDEVVYQRDPVQFSPAELIPTTTAGEVQYLAVETALTAAEPITDADVVYFSTTAQNEREFATIGNHVFCRE